MTKDAVRRVIAAGFGGLFDEVRLKFSLTPGEVFASNRRPAPRARGLLYVRMTEKGWSRGRIAQLVQRDISSVRLTIERYHQGMITQGIAVQAPHAGHWLGGPGPYVDGLLKAFWALADDEL